MIKKLITNSRITEIDAVTNRLVTAYKSSKLNSDTYLAGLFLQIENENENLNSAIRRSKIASELDDLDIIRDKFWRSLYYLVFGLTYHPNKNVKAAANEVMNVLDQYGLSIVEESYSSESSLIDSCLKDLEQPLLLEAIGKLTGCTELVASLQTAQNNFEEKRVAYETEKAKVNARENATAIKMQVLDLINQKLIPYMEVMTTVDKLTFHSFGLIVAEIVRSNNEAVERRQKKGDKETE